LKFSLAAGFNRASAGFRTSFAAITMRRAEAPPARCQPASIFQHELRRVGLDVVIGRIDLRGATGPEDRLAVGCIGLAVVVGEQLSRAGRLCRSFGRGQQFEARRIKVVAAQHQLRAAGEFKDFIGENIRLEPVNLNHLHNSDELLSFFMGKNTPERQDFIIGNLRIEKDLVEV
jgi:hypothetical protein